MGQIRTIFSEPTSEPTLKDKLDSIPELVRTNYLDVKIENSVSSFVDELSPSRRREVSSLVGAQMEGARLETETLEILAKANKITVSKDDSEPELAGKLIKKLGYSEALKLFQRELKLTAIKPTGNFSFHLGSKLSLGDVNETDLAKKLQASFKNAFPEKKIVVKAKKRVESNRIIVGLFVQRQPTTGRKIDSANELELSRFPRSVFELFFVLEYDSAKGKKNRKIVVVAKNAKHELMTHSIKELSNILWPDSDGEVSEKKQSRFDLSKLGSQTSKLAVLAKYKGVIGTVDVKYIKLHCADGSSLTFAKRGRSGNPLTQFTSFLNGRAANPKSISNTDSVTIQEHEVYEICIALRDKNTPAWNFAEATIRSNEIRTDHYYMIAVLEHLKLWKIST